MDMNPTEQLEATVNRLRAVISDLLRAFDDLVLHKFYNPERSFRAVDDARRLKGEWR